MVSAISVFAYVHHIVLIYDDDSSDPESSDEKDSDLSKDDKNEAEFDIDNIDENMMSWKANGRIIII